MARLTVEDCLHQVENNNRFKLIAMAVKRARELERGANTQLSWDNDKPTVVSLREIALGLFPRAVVEAASPAIAPPVAPPVVTAAPLLEPSQSSE